MYVLRGVCICSHYKNSERRYIKILVQVIHNGLLIFKISSTKMNQYYFLKIKPKNSKRER